MIAHALEKPIVEVPEQRLEHLQVLGTVGRAAEPVQRLFFARVFTPLA